MLNGPTDWHWSCLHLLIVPRLVLTKRHILSSSPRLFGRSESITSYLLLYPISLTSRVLDLLDSWTRKSPTSSFVFTYQLTSSFPESEVTSRNLISGLMAKSGSPCESRLSQTNCSSLTSLTILPERYPGLWQCVRSQLLFLSPALSQCSTGLSEHSHRRIFPENLRSNPSLIF